MKPKTVVIILVIVFLVLLLLGKARRWRNPQPPYPTVPTTAQQGIPNTGGQTNTAPGDSTIDGTLSSLDALVNSSNPTDFSADDLTGLE